MLKTEVLIYPQVDNQKKKRKTMPKFRVFFSGLDSFKNPNFYTNIHRTPGEELRRRAVRIAATKRKPDSVRFV